MFDNPNRVGAVGAVLTFLAVVLIGLGGVAGAVAWAVVACATVAALKVWA